MPEFEFDPGKSRINLAKHGIDFVQAQELWLDPDLSWGPTDSETEVRLKATGVIGGKLWTALITFRGRKIRIISVRRARKEEVNRYDAGQARRRNT